MDSPLFETKDNNIYQIKKISRLYNLTPIGIGTPFVESLTSYIIRLAEAHNITPGILIGKEITNVLNKRYLKNTAVRGGSGLYKSASSLNGIKSASLDLVASLEDLTLRNDLSFLTMLTWSAILPTRGLLRSQKAWCPECFKDWKMSGNPIYEPLIWFIKEVVICPIHKISLQTICPSCAKGVPTLSRNTRHGYCSNCFHWLGEEKEDHSLNKEINFWDSWRAKNIGELLETTPLINIYTDGNRIKDILRLAVDTNGVNSKFIHLLDIPKSTFKSWVDENKNPSLSYLLRISYCLGITLNQLLTEDFTNIKFNFQPFNYKNNVNNSLNQRFPEGYIEKQLIYWVTSNVNPPPSVKEIASIIGCDRRLLYKKDADLCKIISKKHLNYVKECSQKRIESLKKRIIEAINILHNKGIYPSRRKVEEFLKMSGAIKEEAIRYVWKQEISKLKN